MNDYAKRTLLNEARLPHPVSQRGRHGFTLVELLVVISIIAILAAMLLPVLSSVKTKALKKKAQMEAAQLVQAIRDYDSHYNRFPVSADAVTAAAGQTDFTYGTRNVTCAGTTTPSGFKTPSGAQPVDALDPTGAGSLSYQTNNAELMAMLLDLEVYGNGMPTINKGHVKNPQRTKFLNANVISTTAGPGVGADGVYRDPWGNPYIITIDLNNDEKAADGFYRKKAVSQQSNQTGIFGLYNSRDAAGNGNNFEYNGPVMVWSAGPDKMIDPSQPANAGANKDNIVSWGQP
jgi:prepilin-type N-terminal cleavage/methylation domain-containing protein